MSGGYGAPRLGRVKIRTKIQFPDTNKRVNSNIFLNQGWSYDDIQIKLNAKYPDKYPILLDATRVKHRLKIVA